MNFRAFGRFAILSAALGLGVLVGCTPSPPPPETAKPVELKNTTIAELEDEIAIHKGKVVLIDVWFLGCEPCVKRFPKFVEIHNELKSEGLVCLTVDVYEEELKKRDKVLEFLKEKGADTLNFIVADNIARRDAWQKKYDAEGTPSYVIFDRQGRHVRTPQPEDKENISRFLKKLLSEK